MITYKVTFNRKIDGKWSSYTTNITVDENGFKALKELLKFIADYDLTMYNVWIETIDKIPTEEWNIKGGFIANNPIMINYEKISNS